MQDFNTEFIDNLKKFNEKYTELAYILSNKKFHNYNEFFDYESLKSTYLDAVNDFVNNPSKFMKHNFDYAEKLSKLMLNYYSWIIEGKNLNNININKDRRFKNKIWEESIYYSFIKQFYQVSSDWYRNMVNQLEIPEEKKNILSFYTDQMLNAACPTNFPQTNPDVINEIVNTNGKNLIDGLENFINDIKESGEFFRVSTTNKDYFKIGENIASTPGKVILRNDLAELICYEPSSEGSKIPIFIVPPWINKYYILDLSQENSFIKFLIDSGFQVFLVSWNNPNESLSHKSFEDYLKEGIVDFVEFIIKNTSIKKMHLLGYCLGGTLSACALSYFKKHKKDEIFPSTTFLTTMLDFSNPGELGLFINEQTSKAIFNKSSEKGYFDGSLMSNTFSILRVNDLIWSFFVNNYLLGKKPMQFDILYWNSDSTNLPASMHKFYIENMYLYNSLMNPNKINLLNTPIDLSEITSKIFFLSTKEDHIAPWKSTYDGMKIFKKSLENIKFCLAGSGHIAGVINSPNNNKYSFWVNDKIENTPDKWLENTQEFTGSWWNEWKKWAENNDVPKIDFDYEALPFLEKAPGKYVKVRNN